jgi:hypothetical protein
MSGRTQPLGWTDKEVKMKDYGKFIAYRKFLSRHGVIAAGTRLNVKQVAVRTYVAFDEAGRVYSIKKSDIASYLLDASLADTVAAESQAVR